MFAVRATYHTTLQASPIQLVFSRDAILNVKHITDWEHIRQRKQQTWINENNKRENKSQRAHQYSLGDKILIKARKHSKHALEYEGPYAITQVNDNGTVRFQKGIVNDVTNIRRANQTLSRITKSSDDLLQKANILDLLQNNSWFTIQTSLDLLQKANHPLSWGWVQ